MLYNYRRKFKTWTFNRQIATIMKTPPLRIVPRDWALVSMVKNRDVPMYLLAIKSLYYYLGAGHIIAIIDGDMPPALRDTLQRHIPGVELLVLEDIDTGSCQRGGTWERLVFLLKRSQHQYVVQMDADILAVGPDMREVMDCISRNVAFTMADGQQFVGMRDAAKRARNRSADYICTAIEQCFDQYPGCDRLRYISGSSGLTGFARGGFTRAGIEEFHSVMQNLLPTRWHEWGSEQCASNFAIANSPGAVALPYPEYGSFGGGRNHERCKCFHFIGTHRFEDNYFAERAQAVIRQLLETVPP